MTFEEIMKLPAPLSAADKEVVIEHVLQNMANIGTGLTSAGARFRSKPILGGAFSLGHFSLGSFCTVVRKLDAVQFFAMEDNSGLVLAVGDTQGKVIAEARDMIQTIGIHRILSFAARVAGAKAEAEMEMRKAAQIAEIEARVARKQRAVRIVPRRRKKIYDACGGKCHYCATPLTLDGKWHIEHKMPRALGGDDAPGNLVAACAPCNHEKLDTTDIEYIAKRQARESA